MIGPSASPLAPSWLSDMPTGVIPVLTTVVPDEAVPPALRDALTKRSQDRLYWMALEADILQNLHPEMLRLTTELVRHSLREVWLQRSQLKF
jgi:hypothetical protein